MRHGVGHYGPRVQSRSAGRRGGILNFKAKSKPRARSSRNDEEEEEEDEEQEEEEEESKQKPRKRDKIYGFEPDHDDGYDPYAGYERYKKAGTGNTRSRTWMESNSILGRK